MASEESARGRTILLTGPPGAGKTRTALVWSATRPTGAFAIDWDAAASTVALADELRGSPAMDLAERYKFAARLVAAQADAITRSGVDCIVVGARAPFPPAEFAQVWEPLDALDPITIVLLPSPDVCAARNAADPTRIGDFAVPDDLVRGSFEFWGWERWREIPGAVVIDTSAMSLEKVIDAVESAVAELSQSERSPM